MKQLNPKELKDKENTYNEHIKYMKRAISLSKKGIGYVNPNPLVGAVIVKDGLIIGEGYHEKIGYNHAEINALNNCKKSTKGATMYVTLEPCSHYGKTPPCVNAIIKSGIKQVIVGMKDPNPLVAGKGIKILRDNNITVTCGICQDEIQELNKIFIKYITTKKPYCIMKTAMTLDGKIATSTGDSKWITSDRSREYVHEIRHKVTAIMVGIGTVIADNPSLTTRLTNQTGVNPIRIIVDTTCRIPLQARVLSEKGKTIIATTNDAPIEKVKALGKKMGITILMIDKKNNRVDMNKLITELGEMEIDSILLEGGSELNYSCLEAGIIDEVYAFIAPKLIGGQQAITPIGGKGLTQIKDAYTLKDIQLEKIDDDILIKGKVN
ncbi:bifunctional diaminohydroxyphosphoribosylaminopyrimidine deaminase/5-amino-6-(5-phosphoribosylamino)uracil reductase RibD [Vallitalea guaymasensis]|uniref:Riboflavin biosynthesis protein RibD n=1 Tax=Vallitalea guaymasensis TaxID=1185412 RepID=A0A8J8SCR0_9FIRM|nr:bifunctional diaminohydroxyphosphoribosylaminopyrimidine deaminase/5-amino-6-(5-phosphoribosylamino)uracil reductase RibD [Vallitalea guaymasensis]QUH30007.1 bifunctional diaminohydroxyphosphoribosylaminopyrimidine deaminase/5-amino-6-(5-phosphoribosylamino)uracil reductase RibD [Vallitalea guaymasensis]